MPKAYISATFTDLKQHRQIASGVVKRFGYDDVAMESYVADDKRRVDQALADVAACDLYIGIFAWRYGNQPQDGNPEDPSITEMEYREAVRRKKARLLFVIDEEAAWPMPFVDVDRTKIAELHRRLRKDRIAGTFSTPDTLEARLSEALATRAERTVEAKGIDATAYVRYLRRRFNFIDVDALTDPRRDESLQLRVQSVFVEPRVREDLPPIELPKEQWDFLISESSEARDVVPAGMTSDVLRNLKTSYESIPSQPVFEVLAAQQNRCSVILGDPGAGKSTLLRMIVLSLIDSARNPRLEPGLAGCLPFLVDLRTFAALRAQGRCETLFDYFDVLRALEGCPADGDALRRFLESTQRAAVLFDGIDEVVNPAEHEHITRAIISFALAFPTVRIIVSSRIIGYRRTLLSDAGFHHFTMQDLDEPQIVEFVAQWYALTLGNNPVAVTDRVARIRDAIATSPSFRQLAGNPMLLTTMAILGKYRDLPTERWRLYDHAASILVQHWDVQKHLSESLTTILDEEDKKELLRQLAFAMQSGDGGLAGNYIHEEELQKNFATYFKDRYALQPDRAAIVAKEILAQFRERNFILSSYGGGLYGFVHRAFLEFFCAAEITRRFEKTAALSLDALKTGIFGKHWNDKVWHEVLRLICGMIGEQYAGELIRYLRLAGLDTTGGRNIALAVACLSDVRRIDLIEEESRALLFSLLEWLGRVIALSGDDSVVRQEISAATDTMAMAAQIGNKWADRGASIEWMLALERGVWRRESIGAPAIGTFVGSLTAGSETSFLQLIEHAKKAKGLTIVAISYALVRGWPNQDETLKTLQQLAAKDSFDTWGPIYAAASHLSNVPAAVDWVFENFDSRARMDAADAITAWLYKDPRAIRVLAWKARSSDFQIAMRRLEELIREPAAQGVLAELAMLYGYDDTRQEATAILRRHDIAIQRPPARRSEKASR